MHNNLNLNGQPAVGMWMYQNGGGSEIEQQLVELLKKKGISTITNLDLVNAVGSEHGIICNDVLMADLACFFSYNAGGTITLPGIYVSCLESYHSDNE